MIALAAPVAASERSAALDRLRDIVEQEATLRGRYAGYTLRCADAAASRGTTEREFLRRVKSAEEQTGAALAQVAARALADGRAAASQLVCGDAGAEGLVDGLLLLDDQLADQIEQVKAILEEEEPAARGGTSVFARPAS